MAKLWIVFIVLFGIVFLGGMIWAMKKQADRSTKASKQLTEAFKKVDKNLDSSSHAIDSLNKILDSIRAIKNN